MGLFVRPFEGEAVFFETARRSEPATSAQVLAERYALWLQSYEVGLFDPETGKDRRRSRLEIAALWSVSVETVRKGLKEAREQRQFLEELNA